MLRICPMEINQSESFLSIDPRKKQVTVYDPAQSGIMTSAHRKPGINPPKMFGFDACFSQDDSMVRIFYYRIRNLGDKVLYSVRPFAVFVYVCVCVSVCLSSP